MTGQEIPEPPSGGLIARASEPLTVGGMARYGQTDLEMNIEISRTIIMANKRTGLQLRSAWPRLIASNRLSLWILAP